ncbi:hypothetical protein JW992_11235 [candidate division KSB1 bacterium]|nr:hypothetical protein [candidate division KSB1 bacterium]
MRPIFCFLLLSFSLGVASDWFSSRETIDLVIPQPPFPPAVRAAAQALHEQLPASRIRHIAADGRDALVLDVVAPDFLPGAPARGDWIYCRLSEQGNGELYATTPALLYAAANRLIDVWRYRDDQSFGDGRFFQPTFEFVEGGDGFFASRLFWSKEYDPKATLRELARIGCSHVAVNALATPFPYEQGPPGEHYYRFYITNPDLDQFVESDLNRGIYPPEYLAANLNQMHANTQAALAVGLRPGLNLCSPRSVPESFFDKYPHLRGARVDHPFHSYRPRYTMTLAHPIVRWHMGELMRQIMAEIPELDYAYVWSNDSGSGFEHTATTYAGRNGGAFLVREWLSDEEIAEKAGLNIIAYLQTLLQSGREINPGFRVILRLFSFPAAQSVILDHLQEGVDLRLIAAPESDSVLVSRRPALENKGSSFSMTVELAVPYSHIPGVPFPWLARKRLQNLRDSDIDRIVVNVHPPSLAPRDINREIFQAYQLEPDIPVTEIVRRTALNWVGEKHAPALMTAWQLADSTVANFPAVPLYQGYGFVPFRLWVRPLVPNIEAIPKRERAYYEDYMLQTPYNPALTDLSKNALWTLVPVETAQAILDACEKQGYRTAQKAVQILDQALAEEPLVSRRARVLADQRDRLRGYVCYTRTLVNTAAWIVSVHGYLNADRDAERRQFRENLTRMIDDEIANSHELLDLWRRSHTPFMPVSAVGENWYTYGDNFGELLEKRIELMKKHRDDIPAIDKNLIWRMPAECPVDPSLYLPD